MTTDKFLLKSKTIIGILLTAFVALAPQFGINFTADDSALISQSVDAIIQAVTLTFAAYGRIAAKDKVTV